MNKNLTTGKISISGDPDTAPELITKLIETVTLKLKTFGELDFAIDEVTSLHKNIRIKLQDHQDLIQIEDSVNSLNGMQTFLIGPDYNEETIFVDCDNVFRIYFDLTTIDFEAQKQWNTYALKDFGFKTYTVTRTCS